MQSRHRIRAAVAGVAALGALAALAGVGGAANDHANYHAVCPSSPNDAARCSSAREQAQS